MIDRQIVRKTRQKMHLSQAELAKNITTQSTVSRLEKDGVAPSTEVTNKLLRRLNLQLDDVLIDETPIAESILDEADEAAQVFDHQAVLTALKKITPKIALTEDNHLHMQFLKTNATMWITQDYMQAVFDFNKMLDSVKNKSQSIYTVLATCQLGTAYFSDNKEDSAEYYFNQIPSLLADINVKQNLYWTLFILDNLTNFWSRRFEFAKSNKYGEKALSIIKKYHTLLFADTLNGTVGENYGYSEGWNSPKAQQHLIEAWSFAKFSDNKIVCDLLEQDFKKHHIGAPWLTDNDKENE